MAFRLYVGNYPCSFTKKDVENLFLDFDGIKVDKTFENKTKSFSFLTCKDIDQLVSVIKKMNRTLVSGRNLVVRASDERLQEYVELILQNDEPSSSEMALSTSSETPFVPVQVMKNKYRQPLGKSDCEKSGKMHYKSDAYSFQKNFRKHDEDSEVSANKSDCSSRFMHNKYQHKQDVSDCASANVSSVFSKAPNKVNNQRSPGISRNNTYSSKSPLNSYQTASEGISANDSNLRSKTLHNVNNQRTPRSNDESFKNNTHSFKNPLNNYQTFHSKNENECFETDSNHSSGSLLKSYHNATKQINSDFPENVSPKSYTCRQSEHERYYHDQISENSCSGYSYNNAKSFDNQASRNTGCFSQQRDSSSPAWISVANFRINTCTEALYELFSDYNPLKIKMICNVPRRDKFLTEAHVCFPNKDVADDVILNFDNTMFEGRIILVNDVEDLSIMNELLNVSHS